MEVNASDELLGIAQMAVGVAGLAGVAAAILLERSFQRAVTWQIRRGATA